MITRMAITYKSKKPTDIAPAIFTSGGYTVIKDGKEFSFDFMDSEYSVRHENGYLHMDCLCKNYDEDAYLPQEDVDHLMRSLTKSDFIDIFYECFADEDMQLSIDLMPEEIIFFDYSTTGDGKPIEVLGKAFDNLINDEMA